MVTTIYPDPLAGATPPPGYETSPQPAPSGPNYGAINGPPPSEQPPPPPPGKEVSFKRLGPKKGLDLNEAIELCGFGTFQWLYMMLFGIIYLSDAAEIALSSKSTQSDPDLPGCSGGKGFAR
eukprot:sb/3476005/